MTVRGLLLVLLTALITATSNLVLRAGIDAAGGFSYSTAGWLRLAKSPLFLLGIFLYGSASLVWFRVVASEPLSTAYPVLVSMTFIGVSLGAMLLFRESYTYVKFMGLVLIIAGIIMVSKG